MPICETLSDLYFLYHSVKRRISFFLISPFSTLEQWSSSAGRRWFCTTGAFDKVWRCFGLWDEGGKECLLASSGKKTGMLLNFLWCTRQPLKTKKLLGTKCQWCQGWEILDNKVCLRKIPRPLARNKGKKVGGAKGSPLCRWLVTYNHSWFKNTGRRVLNKAVCLKSSPNQSTLILSLNILNISLFNYEYDSFNKCKAWSKYNDRLFSFHNIHEWS